MTAHNWHTHTVCVSLRLSVLSDTVRGADSENLYVRDSKSMSMHIDIAKQRVAEYHIKKIDSNKIFDSELSYHISLKSESNESAPINYIIVLSIIL